jgi:hypothetical protein
MYGWLYGSYQILCLSCSIVGLMLPLFLLQKATPSGRPSTKRQRLDDGGVGVGVNGINGGIEGLVGGGGTGSVLLTCG